MKRMEVRWWPSKLNSDGLIAGSVVGIGRFVTGWGAGLWQTIAIGAVKSVIFMVDREAGGHCGLFRQNLDSQKLFCGR